MACTLLLKVLRELHNKQNKSVTDEGKIFDLAHDNL
jgi:hypothetical protein